MLRKLKNLRKSLVQSKSEENIGEIRDFYFDDRDWIIRYLVIDTGSWLSEKLVLVSPFAIEDIGIGGFTIKTNMTRYQIEHCPSAEAHKPIDRLFEEKYARYYGWPLYWTAGNDLLSPGNLPQAPIEKTIDPKLEKKIKESHLRSFNDLIGYNIHAADEQFGHVEDLVVDDESFQITDLIVDTVNFWPSKSVLMKHQYIHEIDWAERVVRTNLTRDEVESFTEYDPFMFIDRPLDDEGYRSQL